MSPRPISPPATVFAWSGAAFGPAAEALFALDAALGDVVRGTRTPMVGQMRLTWWHDALHALDDAPAPAQPVLQALAAHVLPRVSGAALAAMIDGWDVLIEEETIDAAALSRFAEARGGGLFAALAVVIDGPSSAGVTAAGRGWALADLAARLTTETSTAAEQARVALHEALAAGWHGAARPIGALARDAALAIDGRGAPGGPRRAAAVLWHALTGR